MTITDSDVTDNDITDSDITDSDITDNDITDGDSTDSDITDSDSDSLSVIRTCHWHNKCVNVVIYVEFHDFPWRCDNFISMSSKLRKRVAHKYVVIFYFSKLTLV